MFYHSRVCLLSAETQQQLAVAVEKERTATEQVLDLGAKVASLETQTTRLRTEKTQLTVQLESLKARTDKAEETKQQWVVTCCIQIQSFGHCLYSV